MNKTNEKTVGASEDYIHTDGILKTTVFLIGEEDDVYIRQNYEMGSVPGRITFSYMHGRRKRTFKK
jgi:hypothetical protein